MLTRLPPFAAVIADRRMPPSRNRRGVLLLVTVSMLTLFLLLGTTYLIVAVRARQAARAQARLAMENAIVKPSSLLDAVLLKVIRGGAGGVVDPALVLATSFESLLADRYGPGVTGTASGLVAVAGTPLITGTLTTGTSAGLERASDLPGRVITLLGSDREPTSHRILRATATGAADISAVVVLDNPPRRRPFSLSDTLPVVVNGLDFSGTSGNESYDGFDAENAFLAHLQPADSRSPAPSVAQSVVSRASYVPTLTGTAARAALSELPGGLARGADNDNDGTPDAFFLDFGLPRVAAPDGSGSLRFDASVLVVDLDSRFNVNAHGSLAPSMYPTGCVGWPQADGDVPTLANAPLGSGYGPAEVNTMWMFPKASYPAEKSRRMRGSSDPARNQSSDSDEKDPNQPIPPSAVQPGPFLLSGADNTAQAIQNRPDTSRFAAGNALPKIGDVEGRYGEGSLNLFTTAATALSQGQTGANWSRLDSDLASFSIARPGEPRTNDTLSRVRDFNLTPNANNEISGAGAGVPNLWWTGTAGFNWASYDGTTPRGVFNSPPDLHGRMLTTTATSSAIVPRLMFAAPEWGNEATDDPYEVRLDPKAARTGSVISSGTMWDNVYGYAELEGLLRQYDRDGQQLPKRLLAVLGPASEEARLRVTTDSWDTTMVTGSAARFLRTFMRSGTGTITGTTAVTGLINNELARGERLNLNRPLTAAKPAAYDAAHPYYAQRQALFKDLFTLLVALGEPASEENAQWAANVVEFQDADSTMTPFEYDTQCGNPPYGWTVDGDITTATAAETGRRAVVWGAERPEIVIREAFAWTNSSRNAGGFVLSLHRPWNALAHARVSGSNTSIVAEPCDVGLETNPGTPTNRVALGRKSDATASDVSPDSLPLWRLRIVASGTSHVRFDSDTGNGNEFVISPAITSGADAPTLATDATLTISSTATILTGSPADPGLAHISVSGSSVMVSGPVISQSGTATAYLERLSDLGFALTTSGTVPGKLVAGGSANGLNVWESAPSVIGSQSETQIPVRYITVDQCTFQPVQTDTVTPGVQVTGFSAARTTSGTSTAFWKSPTSGGNPQIISPGATINLPTITTGTDSAWFVWPNRPLVSAAELFLVPKGSAGGMLASYRKPSSVDNDLLTLTGTNSRLLLDAVHVPSRFACIHTTVNASGTAALANHGIFPNVSPMNQLSSYREPGRVNLNTVTSDDVWNAVVAGPLQVSGSAKPLVTSGAAGANFATTPAKGMLDILALASSGTAPRGDTYVGNAAMAAAKDRNPLHEFYTATRLANTATTRSNVFAIWITVRETVDGDPDTVKLHRAFYIVDRSIPVAYEPGKDHNVWDCVVLRRIIE